MARKSPTPTLAPVRACFPTASVEVTNEALPLASVTVASTVAPSLNVTVPVGTPVPGATGLTTAVSVTAWPITDGFGGAVRLVVGLEITARFTARQGLVTEVALT